MPLPRSLLVGGLALLVLAGCSNAEEDPASSENAAEAAAILSRVDLPGGRTADASDFQRELPGAEPQPAAYAATWCAYLLEIQERSESAKSDDLFDRVEQLVTDSMGQFDSIDPTSELDLRRTWNEGDREPVQEYGRANRCSELFAESK